MSQMRRFMSFRDFDWTLLGLVLALCLVSVLEIYSATLHTKYVGFHTKQIYWICGGLVAMLVLSRIDYHKLIDFVPWFYGFFLIEYILLSLHGMLTQVTWNFIIYALPAMVAVWWARPRRAGAFLAEDAAPVRLAQGEAS